jgi:hypothetical protein
MSFLSSLAILAAMTLVQSFTYDPFGFFYMSSVVIVNIAILLLLSQDEVARAFPQRNLNSENSGLVPFLVFVQLFFALYILFIFSQPYGYFTSWGMIFLNQALIIVVLMLLAIPFIVSHIGQSWYILLALNVWFFVLSAVGIGTILTQPYSIAVEQEYAEWSLARFTLILGPGLLLSFIVLGLLGFTMPGRTLRKKKSVSADLSPAIKKHEEPEETISYS